MAVARRSSSSATVLAAGRSGVVTRTASSSVVLAGGHSGIATRCDSEGVVTKHPHVDIIPQYEGPVLESYYGWIYDFGSYVGLLMNPNVTSGPLCTIKFLLLNGGGDNRKSIVTSSSSPQQHTPHFCMSAAVYDITKRGILYDLHWSWYDAVEPAQEINIDLGQQVYVPFPGEGSREIDGT